MLTFGQNILWGFCFIAFLMASQLASGQFIELSEKVGINHLAIDPTNLSGGVAFFDYQNDGFEDIYLIGGGKRDKLYENQGDGTFQDVTYEMGLGKIFMVPTMGVACGDIDNDGFTDLLITTKGKERTYLFWNDEGTSFKEGAVEAGIEGEYYGSSAAFGDYNLDGLLDLYIGNYDPGNQGDYLYKNNGDRSFTDVSYLLGQSGMGTALAVAFSDLDGDHDPDILVGNDFGFQYEPNRIFSNNYPEESFSEVSKQKSWDLEINSMGIAVGDYDEDGDLDYYVSDIGDNYLFNNQSGGTFIEEARGRQVENAEGTSWGNAFFDFNNDSFLDLFIANGIFETGPTNQVNRLYKGDKDTFEDVSLLQKVAHPARGRGLAIGDYDNDGYQDILVGVVGVLSDNHHSLLYRNPGNDNNWLKVRLKGVTSNASAYGSLVEVKIGDRKLIRELSGGTSYLSHMSTVIHFGLGKVQKVDSLKIIWPDGAEQTYSNLEINKSYAIVEGGELYECQSIFKTIPEGTSVFLEGMLRDKAGIYRDTLFSENHFPKITTTRLALTASGHTITGLPEVEDKFMVWPNPFTDDLTVSLSAMTNPTGACSIKIYDLTGQLLFEHEAWLTGNPFQVKLPKLPYGTHLLQLMVGDQQFTRRIIRDKKR